MEKLKIERNAYIFDETEKNKLLECLRYCLHRLVQHKGENGLERSVKEKFVNYLIGQFEESSKNSLT